MNSFGFSIRIIMSSVSATVSPLPLQCRHFLFFSSLTAVVRTPTAVFSVSGKSAHPCLIPDFSAKMSSFSPLSIMLAVGLL